MNTKTAYRVIRSARKTVSIELCPDLTVLVRAPQWAGEAEIARLVEKHAGWIEKRREQMRAERASTPPPATESEIRALKEAANATLPGLIARYEAAMGVKSTRLTVTRARTRHGSCSGRNALSFSCYLMRYPADLIEYVVVHELAHIRHKNHGPAFYAFVASILPDYEARQARIRALDKQGFMRG